MRKKSSIIILLLLASTVALGACSKNNNNNVAPVSPSASAPSPSPVAGAGGTADVTVNAVNWAFDPAVIKAKVGDTLRITLNNTQGGHGLEIPDMNVKIKNGETKEVKLDKAGTYDFHCFIMCGAGHTKMKGQIVVE